MLNLKIEATSACSVSTGVFGHWSSSLINKESKLTGIIADNHLRYLIMV